MTPVQLAWVTDHVAAFDAVLFGLDFADPSRGYADGESGWHARLMEDPAFEAQVQARWHELRDGPFADEAMAARIAAHADELATAAEDNGARWDNLDEPVVNGFVSPVTPTWEGQVDALQSWLVDRSAWIDGAIGGG